MQCSKAPAGAGSPFLIALFLALVCLGCATAELSQTIPETGEDADLGGDATSARDLPDPSDDPAGHEDEMPDDVIDEGRAEVEDRDNYCGDGTCGPGENAANCELDCPAECGDGFCTHDETAQSCELDCPADCGDGFCTHGETVLTCSQDCSADCGDGHCTHDENAQNCALDCPASCGDGFCTHNENAQNCALDCPAECGDGFCTHDEDSTSCSEDCPISCGDGNCDEGENAANCAADCPAVCPDGFCTHDETAQTCPQDCPASCGDGLCTHAETASNCSRDCPAVCPDGFCTHDETAQTCPQDCAAVCPDGFCTHGENANTCPQDCAAVCPDGFCTHGENANTCPQDCAAVCPDGFCTHDETAQTCPQDCPAECGDGFCTHDENNANCSQDCPLQPSYSWEAASFIDLRLDSTATQVTSIPEGQGTSIDGWVSLEIGFPFPFYGVEHSTAYVSTNGLITFGAGSSEWSNVAIPNGAAPNNMIAVFWDDLKLVTERNSRILYSTRGTAPNRHLIVQWQDLAFFMAWNFITFQAILHENGTIQMLYHDMTGESSSSERITGDSATVGIENAAGTRGVQYAFSAAGRLEPGLILSYVPNDSGSYDLFEYANLVGEFIDIRSSGAVRSDMNEDDAVSAPVDIGFPFTFYGLEYTQVQLSTNGWLGFGTGFSLSTPYNTSLPAATAPSPIVACFWDDGHGGATRSLVHTQVIGSAGQRVFVAQYTDWGFYGTSDYWTTYQVRLHEQTGVVDCVYGPLVASAAGGRHQGADATVGIQNSTATLSQQVLFRDASLKPGDRVAFYPRGEDNANYRAVGPDGYWLDISRTGTASTAVGDDSSQTISFPFSFDYYGGDITSVTITTNGQLNLEGSTSWSNTSLPSTSAPVGLIGPFWDDLHSGNGAIYYQTLGSAGDRVFVVQWQRNGFMANTNSDLTFQVRFYEYDAAIEFGYGGLLSHSVARDRVSGRWGTIGLQNQDRTQGLEVGYNDAGVAMTGGEIIFYRPR